jgi:hypothetical protein
MKIELPIYGKTNHKCRSCKIVSFYSGLLFFSNLNDEHPIRSPVRYCPTCGSRVLPGVSDEKEGVQ